MNILILDTATEKGVVALYENGKVLEIKNFSIGPHLPAALSLSIQDLLQKFSFTPELIACGKGPGSYTGIRAAASLAKGLALGFKVPLISFSSFEAFLPALFERGSFALLFDAKSGGVYTMKGKKENGSFFLEPPEKMSLLEAQSIFKETPYLLSPQKAALESKLPLKGKWIDAGPNVALLAKRLEADAEKRKAEPFSLTYLGSP